MNSNKNKNEDNEWKKNSDSSIYEKQDEIDFVHSKHEESVHPNELNYPTPTPNQINKENKEQNPNTNRGLYQKYHNANTYKGTLSNKINKICNQTNNTSQINSRYNSLFNDSSILKSASQLDMTDGSIGLGLALDIKENDNNVSIKGNKLKETNLCP